jgi:hypothetical protein
VPFVPFDAEALAQGAMVTCTSLFRRSAWDDIGGLDETMVLCEDWDLWLTFAERSLCGVMIPRVLWAYRQHGPSMVNRKIFSPHGLRREYTLISQLQERHPSLFAPRLLVRRLLATPRRVRSGQMSIPVAVKLIGFYGVMLMREWMGVCQARPRHPRLAMSGADSVRRA